MNRFVTIFALILVIVAIAPTAKAATLREQREEIKASNQAIREQRQETRTENEEKRAAAKAERCALIADRIELHIGRYDSNRSLFMKWGENMVGLTEAAIAKATAADLDTTDVSAKLTVFKGKISETKSLYVEYIEALKETKAYACGESQGAFKEQLTESRAILNEVRANMLELRKYYQTELRPAMQAVRQQAAANKTAE